MSFAASPEGSAALAITAVTATNNITDNIDSDIDNSLVQAIAPGAR